MKKSLGALLLICMFLICTLIPCALAEAAYEPLLFTLWGENREGYDWSCNFEGDDVLEAPIVEYAETENGVNYAYNFGVKAPGRTQLVFNYGANFEISMPERTMICTAIVGEDGGCTLRRVERYSGDHILVVTLPSNPAAGADWNYEEDPSGMVTLVSEEYVPVDAALEGAGGDTVYTLRVEKPGEALLLFDYADVWNPSAEAQQTYAVLVTANEDMEISMSVDEQ